jgi:sugar phosphate isomerase/epimerase
MIQGADVNTSRRFQLFSFQLQRLPLQFEGVRGAEMKNSKGRYPFRIGCTSYVKPDDIIPNVEYMAGYVDDIELVLFESPEISNLPSSADVDRLAELAAEHSLTYSVHFPTTHQAWGVNAEAFRSDLKKVVELAAPLDPFAWILHFEGLKSGSSDNVIAEWRGSCDAALRALGGAIRDMSRVSVENLSYPWILHAGVVRDHGASLCLDIGHLWLSDPHAWEEGVLGMLPHTRVVHFHGLKDGRDHLSLGKSERKPLEVFISHLRKSGYSGLVTLEVFSEPDTAESLEIMAELWEGSC